MAHCMVVSRSQYVHPTKWEDPRGRRQSPGTQALILSSKADVVEPQRICAWELKRVSVSELMRETGEAQFPQREKVPSSREIREHTGEG